MFKNKYDITADMARKNNKLHEMLLEERRNKYINTLCRQIKNVSSNGGTGIITADLQDEIMTYEFMMKIKDYFEQRGFIVEEQSSCSGVLTSWLRISWE